MHHTIAPTRDWLRRNACFFVPFGEQAIDIRKGNHVAMPPPGDEPSCLADHLLCSSSPAIECSETQQLMSRDQGDQEWACQSEHSIPDRVRHVVTKGRELALGLIFQRGQSR
jgi:hypothetical protein